jgi:hypothetical protein
VEENQIQSSQRIFILNDHDAVKMAKEMIADDWLAESYQQLARKVIELLERQRWIPVSESPPHLVTVLCHSSQGNTFTANCCKGHLWNLPVDYQDDEVTYWMPLPQPPEQP